jgi:hypothetical protein
MDNVPDVVPPLVAATQAETPSPDLPPPGESSMPAPTAEQQTVADRVFTDPHPAATLLGILTSAMLLRDVAVDTFAVSEEEDEDKEEKPKLNEPEA